ncbi:DNA adenine methylase [Chakrabartyella piscis]|uniref:DNA adenine methylase n=1 Tax=Chakrabartyella piscis TaxID=2918914 RepID=UPI00295883C7|nr:DNA adenine methylase [Chakrabartyella piscis]
MKKSIIAWVGGKSKLMWIINLLAPNRYERSIDVFGGSGTVTLNLACTTANLRVYNDFNGNLVNLMRCARDRPLELIREIGFLALNARDDFEMYKKFIEKDEFSEYDLEEELKLTEIMFEQPKAKELKRLLIKQSEEKDIKRAAAYYKLLRYSFNANADTFGGKKCDVRRFFVDIWNFSRAFRNITIENKDFEALIKQYDREMAFIYCDPPYYDAESFYKNDVPFTKEDHVRLRDVLHEAKGYVMVSYNNVPEILELYKDFYIYHTTRSHSMSKKKGEVYEELIIINYDITKYVNNGSYQMQLFGGFSSVQNEGEYSLLHSPSQPLRR